MTSLHVDSRPIIKSTRLRAEPVELRHAATMERVLNDPRIFQFLSEDPPTLSHLERQYAFLAGGRSPDGTEHWLTWILVPLDAGAEPVGFIQATVKEPESAHIAYVLRADEWRKGYGREAVTALLDMLVDRYRIARVVAEMDTRNQASTALVRSLGFRHVRTVEDVAEFKGSTSHEYVYELTPSEWRQLRTRTREP